MSDFEVMQTLGTGTHTFPKPINSLHIGSFGRVRLARNKKTNDFVAVKMLKKAEILRLKQVDHIISENTILSNI